MDLKNPFQAEGATAAPIVAPAASEQPPAAKPASEPVASSSDDSQDWAEGLNNDFDSEDGVVAEPTPVTGKQAEPASAVVEPVATPAASEATALPTPPAAAEPAAAAATPLPASTPEPAAEPAHLPTPPGGVQFTDEQLAEQRNELVSRFEKVYSMSEDDGIEFLKSPETVIPKLLAKQHVSIVDSTLAAVRTILPQMLSQELERSQQSVKAKDAFYGAWPELNKPEYAETLQRIGSAYRQQNPQANLDTFIREVGAIGMVHFRIPPKGFLPNGPVVAPTTPMHKPPQPGAGSPPPAAKPQRGQFETLAEEILADGE